MRPGRPLGGLGYDVRMRPDNPDLMYVTDAWAGVFISADGGQMWLPTSEGIAARTCDSGDGILVKCVTIDPENHGILWAGAHFQRGILRPSDSGKPWMRVDGALGVRAVWGMFLAMFAIISPRDRLLRVFAGIVELGDAMAFVPVLLALLIAFLMGGLGGVSGALVAGLRSGKT